MRTPVRLAAYGAALVGLFGLGWGLARAWVPGTVVATWRDAASKSGHAHAPAQQKSSGHVHAPARHELAASLGLGLSERGYVLDILDAPEAVGEEGTLSFRILGPTGEALSDFAVSHERQMHVMVVRGDGEGFRHVHPTLDAGTGRWSLPWRWERAGTYRLFADFAPTAGRYLLYLDFRIADEVRTARFVLDARPADAHGG